MGASTSKVAAKDSLYELLGVSIDADETQLKKAYRKKALELHPDRNFNNVEEATRLFANVQAAYDILTDPNERQWYDQRHQNGKYDTYDANKTSASDIRRVTAEQLAKLPNLEYSLITTYFQKLKNEELEAAFSQDVSAPISISESPDFGNRSQSWAHAKQFYDAWSDFSTVKDFSWEDIYPLHVAQDRKTRRKFEQENKKLREAAKREYNAAVRQAVVQLKQNDVRKPEKKKGSDAELRRQQEKQSQAQRQALQRLRNEYEDQDWQKPDETGINGQGNGQGELEAGENECIACEEQFETDFDLQDHKRTAKHKKAVAALRQQMLEEDAAVNGSAPQPTPPPLGKAKKKAKKKQQTLHVMACNTCGVELPLPQLMEHKRVSRHP